MITLIVPEDGSIAEQEMQFLKIKKGSNTKLTLNFYKDIFRTYAWNLASPVLFNVFGKRLKTDDTYVVSKDKDSTDLDFTNAANGSIGLTLNSTDTHAVITGDKDVFTGQEGDKLKVIVDSITYDNIDISDCTSIDDVVSAINTAVGVVVASKFDDDYLRITKRSHKDYLRWLEETYGKDGARILSWGDIS